MQTALVDGQLRKAERGLRGTCKFCDGLMLAKCGKYVSWHWAHSLRENCDPWWEGESAWHIRWENAFPVHWQECVSRDLTGERHIADVKTDRGLTLEFQSSPMSSAERSSREKFYGNMIWIVDGCRGELNAAFFKMGLSQPIQSDPLAYAVEWWGRSTLFRFWSEAKAHVYLDFGEAVIWRLISYNHQKRLGIVGPVFRETFIDDCTRGQPIRLLARTENPRPYPTGGSCSFSLER